MRNIIGFWYTEMASSEGFFWEKQYESENSETYGKNGLEKSFNQIQSGELFYVNGSQILIVWNIFLRQKYSH